MESSRRGDNWENHSSDDRLEKLVADDDEDGVDSSNASAFQTKTPSQPDNLGDFLAPAPLSEAETIQLGKEAIRAFLSSRTVYDAMPKSGRVVIFDVNVNLRLVLYALLEHEIRGAPLWNPSMQRLVGMVTLSDFTDIIRHAFLTEEDPVEILDSHTIGSWRSLIKKNGQALNESEKGQASAGSLAGQQALHRRRDLVLVPPTATLLDACTVLREEGMHRLPIVDPDMQTCLQVITFQYILEYLTTQFSEERRLFDQSIYELGVGTYSEPQTSTFMKKAPASPKEVVTAFLDTPLREVSEMFERHQVSTIPILERETQKVRDVFRRSYIASLDLEQRGIFEWSMGQVLSQYETIAMDRLEPLRTCTPTHTLFQVFVLLAETKASNLTIIDDDGKFLGICSLSDVLGHFL